MPTPPEHSVSYFLSHLLDTSDFPARWFCGQWSSLHGWLHIASDAATWAAYMVVPILLLVLLINKKLPKPWLFWLIIGYYVFCGFVHLTEAAIFWWPIYRVSAVLKVLTAIVSWATIIALVPILPKLLSLRTYEELQTEISQRKKAEETTRITLLRTQSILDTAADIICTVDEQGLIESINLTTLRLTGYEPQRLINQPLTTLFINEASDDEDTLLQKLFAQKTGPQPISHADSIVIRKNGTRFPAEISARKVDYGSKILYTCIIRDTSDREQAKQALLARNQELEQFASVASHDLQEPLRKVSSYASILDEDYADSLDEDGKNYVSIMIDATARMKRLIQDLLAFSRVSSQARPFETVDLNTIMATVHSDMEFRLKETNGTVTWDTLPTLYGDPTQLHQLLQNLVGNGLKYSRQDVAPVVTLSVNNDSLPGHVSITVQDNGIGFDNKYADQIFTIFKRLHNRTEYEGTGIGLAICQKIMEQHSGTITATGHPNQGASFSVHFPISSTAQFTDR